MFDFRRRMNDDMVSTIADDMSVVDVYDLASDIGKECEKLIDLFGSDSITTLVPKVINALELLEAMAIKNEMENTKLQELNDRIVHLENEKQEKAVFRNKFEKELESIEEEWRSESNELMSLVSRLQEENRRYQKEYEAHSLPTDLAADVSTTSTKIFNDTKKFAKYDSAVNLSSHSNADTSDIQLLQRLRGQVDSQRDNLRLKDKELQEKFNEIENLNIQLDRLTNSGRESRKRQKLLQVQVRSLVEERADFLAQLQDQHREIIALKKRLGIAEKENEDLSNNHDSDDPHRPRYTTAELKEILLERDDLRAKIADLEEELKLYKPIENNVKIEEEKITEEDPPVQGPLPFEPDDAPWKKSSETGIRKFFRKLFSEPGSTSSGSTTATTSFPRRSLSTLSKMALSASPYSDATI